MDYCSDLEDESTSSAKEIQLETDVATQQGERSIQDPFRVMYSLWHEVTFAETLQLETQIRATKQRGRSIEELFTFMSWLWNQMEPKSLMKSSSYRKFQEEKQLIQFLLALRDEFEPFKRSLLSRSPVPSLEEVISELKDEEARLRSSSGYLEIKTEFGDDIELVSMLSSPSTNTEEKHDPTIRFGSGGTLRSLAESAAASPAVAEVSDHFDGSEESCPGKDSSTIRILTYNVCVWDVERPERMKALCGLIEFHTPDIICFQEVTLDSYNIFMQSSWWNAYDCSVSFEEAAEWSWHFCIQLSKLPVKSFSKWPFRNSRMERELCVAEIQICRGKSLIVATTHLESPDTFRNMHSKERVAQAKKAVKCLQSFQNVIFSGDMNWDDERDGRFPLPEGWIDAWQKLRPWLKGWTCDSNSNPMLAANNPLKVRLDRILCKLNDFKLVKISMIGTEPIPGVSYTKRKRVGSNVQTLNLPVLPSDHYGLLLEIQSN